MPHNTNITSNDLPCHFWKIKTEKNICFIISSMNKEYG